MTDPDESDTDASGDPDDVAGRPTDVGDAGAFGNDEEQSGPTGGAHGGEGGVNRDSGDVDPQDVDPQHDVGDPDRDRDFDDAAEEAEPEVVEWSDVYDSDEEAGAGDAAGAASGTTQGTADEAGSAAGDATPDRRDATAVGGAGTDDPANAGGPNVPANADAGGDGSANAGGPNAPASADAGGGGPATGGTGGVERGPDEKFCQSCGAVIKEAAVVCPECGVEQESIAGTTNVEVSTGGGSAASDGNGNGNDPGVAALLSGIGLLIPIAAGAGQLYNGEVGKGVLFGIIQFINAMLILLIVGLVTYPLFGVFAIYDAYKNADG